MKKALGLLNNKMGRREWNHSTSQGFPPKFIKNWLERLSRVDVSFGGTIKKKRNVEYFDKIFDQVDIAVLKIWKWVQGQKVET